MKVRIVSDLHLEFMENKYEIPKLPEDKDTVLILSGDIHVGTRVEPYIDMWSKQFKHIIYVAGNHEYYRNIYEILNGELKDICSNYDNVYFLNRDYVELEGIQFFGDTFWTPAGEDWENENAKRNMNDFKMIKRIHNQTGKEVSIDTLTYSYWFRDTIEAFNRWTDNGFTGKRVVVSHHAPSSQSIHPHFYGNDLNCFYYFNASKYLKSVENIVLWTHGHMHNCSDYIMRGTDNLRVICNPYGYSGYESNPYFNPLLQVEI